MTATCSSVVNRMASSSGRLLRSPIDHSGCVSERMARRCAICARVSTVKTMVWPCVLPWAMAPACTDRQSPAISRPMKRMCCHMPWANTALAGRAGRGGRCITPRLGGLGRQRQPGEPMGNQVDPEEVNRLQRDGMRNNGASKMVQISPELPTIAQRMNLRRLS